VSRHRRHRIWGFSYGYGPLPGQGAPERRAPGGRAGRRARRAPKLALQTHRPLPSGRRSRTRAPLQAAQTVTDPDLRPVRGRDREDPQGPARPGLRCRGRDHPCPPGPAVDQHPVDVDHLAGVEGPGLRHPPAPQAPPVVVRAFRGRLTERAVADRRHPRLPGRRAPGGDPEPHRRPLEAVRGLQGVRDHHRPPTWCGPS